MSAESAPTEASAAPAVPEVAGPQAEAAVTHRAPAESAPPVLDGAQRALLRSVLNCLIPARADLPGAGELDVGASIEHSMAGSIRLRRLLLDGLGEIAISSERDHQRPFADSAAATQVQILEAIESRQPAFFVALLEHAYRGYYTLPAVHAAIGFESRPPQPLGHTLAPFEPALLDHQRQRHPFWRQATGP